MSDSLAVAAVTACLARLLREPVEAAVPGSLVAHLPPGHPSLEEVPAANVWLLAAQEARIIRPPRPGVETRRSGLPLSLTYLISFHGDDGRLEPQRLLGAVAAALDAAPVLDPALIAQVVGETEWLAGRDLANEGATISIVSASLGGPDAIARLWSGLGAPQRLALLYEVRGVTVGAA